MSRQVGTVSRGIRAPIIREGDDIADPWYTGNFDATWDDIFAGCAALLGRI